MNFIVKVYSLDGEEMELAIGGEEEIIFENEKKAKAFIEGIRFSLPNSWQYRIIPNEDEHK